MKNNIPLYDAYDKKLLLEGDYCYIGNIFGGATILNRWSARTIEIPGNIKYNNYQYIDLSGDGPYFPFGTLEVQKGQISLITKINCCNGLLKEKAALDIIVNNFLTLEEFNIKARMKDNDVSEHGEKIYLYPDIRIDFDKNILVDFGNEIEMPIFKLPNHDAYTLD